MSQIQKIIGLVLLIIGVIWLSSQFIILRDDYREMVLLFSVIIVSFLVIGRRLSLDAKMMLFAFAGYSLGGKGFAYLSPVEPIYVGEITLALAFVGFTVRSVLVKDYYRLSKLHYIFIPFFLYSSMRLVLDYNSYRLLAVRDYAMVYYFLYFVCAFSLLKTNHRFRSALSKVIIYSLYFGIIGRLCLAFNVPIYLAQISPVFLEVFFPHADILISLSAAGSIYFAVCFTTKKKIWYLMLALLCLIIVAMGKTSGVLAVIVLLYFVTFVMRIKQLNKVLIPGALIAILVGVIFTFINPDALSKQISEGEHAKSFTIDPDEIAKQGGSTTGWRITWWTMVTHQAMEKSPAFGVGWGADISSQFFSLSGVVLSEQEKSALARYPHNVFFTVLGRMGLIGIILFMIYIFALLRFSFKFCHLMSLGHLEQADLAAFCIFMAGLVNAFVQATYEPPYAAIPHWLCLAYIVYRYYFVKAKIRLSQSITNDTAGAKA